MGLLGLARRAGAIVPGTEAVRAALRADAVRLVVFAADAAEGQMQKVNGVLKHRPVPVRWAPDRAALGAAVGSGPLTVVAVSGPSFAEPLARALPERRDGWRAGQEESGTDAGR
jgi:ribosomal protein L7Ae-like RNA K-turn-binding protein